MQNVIYLCQEGRVLMVKMKVLCSGSKFECDSVQKKKKKHLKMEHSGRTDLLTMKL